MNEELTEEEKKSLEEAIRNELLQKTDNIIAFTKKVEALIDAIKEEETRLKENRKAYERKLESFKDYVKSCMIEMQIQKIETPLGEMKIAKNPMSVEILDEERIPDAFKRTKVETSIDKKALIEHFKATGELIDGIKINQNEVSLRIK